MNTTTGVIGLLGIVISLIIIKKDSIKKYVSNIKIFKESSIERVYGRISGIKNIYGYIILVVSIVLTAIGLNPVLIIWLGILIPTIFIIWTFKSKVLTNLAIGAVLLGIFIFFVFITAGSVNLANRNMKAEHISILSYFNGLSNQQFWTNEPINLKLKTEDQQEIAPFANLKNGTLEGIKFEKVNSSGNVPIKIVDSNGKELFSYKLIVSEGNKDAVKKLISQMADKDYYYFSYLNNQKYWYDKPIKLDLTYINGNKFNLNLRSGMRAIKFFDLTQFNSTENGKPTEPSIMMNLFDYGTKKTKAYKLVVNESNEQSLKEFLTNIEKSQEEIKKEIYQTLLNSAKVSMKKENFSEALSDIKLAESIESTEEAKKLEVQVAKLKTDAKIKAMLNEAQKYEKENLLTLAKDKYNELIEKYPNSSGAKTAKARIAVINQEIEESKKPPLRFVFAHLDYDSIGIPQVSVRVKNVSKKTVDAYQVAMLCYDRFGDPVTNPQSTFLSIKNLFNGISQRTIKPGEGEWGMPGLAIWALYGAENTAIVEITLTKVHMTDGTTWEWHIGDTEYSIEAKSGY